VPDTVGDGGIVVREKRHAEIAALMAEMASDAGLRMRLEESGKKRVGEFSFERFARRVAELLSALSVRKEAEVCAL
jgi:glycosyltransferase involved in cell wall biosynthesis